MKYTCIKFFFLNISFSLCACIRFKTFDLKLFTYMKINFKNSNERLEILHIFSFKTPIYIHEKSQHVYFFRIENRLKYKNNFFEVLDFQIHQLPLVSIIHFVYFKKETNTWTQEKKPMKIKVFFWLWETFL